MPSDYVQRWENMEEELSNFILEQICNRYQVSASKRDIISGHYRNVIRFKFGRTVTIRIHEDGEIV